MDFTPSITLIVCRWIILLDEHDHDILGRFDLRRTNAIQTPTRAASNRVDRSDRGRARKKFTLLAFSGSWEPSARKKFSSARILSLRVWIFARNFVAVISFFGQTSSSPAATQRARSRPFLDGFQGSLH
jgi:hypothetical protein